jgi:hypothetical protein
MTTRLELQVGSLLNGVAAALEVELETAESEHGITKPCIISPLPGALVAFDYCEDGGMAWARLVTIEPVQDLDPFAACATMYDVTVEIGVLRCAPTLHEDGSLPSREEQIAASLLQNHDMGVLHKVFSCYAAPKAFEGPAIGIFQPVGPDGGCLGGVWTARWRFA